MIRTPEQYIESLSDGREFWILGEKVPDLNKHPFTKQTIKAASMFWVLMNHPKYRDVLTMKDDETGEMVNFLWKQPRSAEDLKRRREVYMTNARIGGGIAGMGPDALAAAGIAASKMDKELGTQYMDAVNDYRLHLKKTDPYMTGAITDVKGDRSLHPMAQKQHQDFYVHVVDRQKDGIIVRGAKMHISSTTVANEAIVLPTRAHREPDKDCAVCFATPLNAKGIKIISSPPHPSEELNEASAWDYPASGEGGTGTSFYNDCMIVFEDTFVPWNRVFMAGEWQYSRDLAWAFATYHRLFGTCAHTVRAQAHSGLGALLAEFNGLERDRVIRNKLAMLARHAAIIDMAGRAACEYPDIDPQTGLAAPNLLYTNVAKWQYAHGSWEASLILADIAGGLVTTVPSYKDWINPEERELIEKYLAGKDGIPTEHRLKAMRLAKELTECGLDQTGIHAEGSLEAQKIALYTSADWALWKAAARKEAKIPGWEEHPAFKDLPKYPPK
jgi:4-hydroxybutyryl-CoA dehydratase/vinylacetyl-CoA-Delta-isomerase